MSFHARPIFFPKLPSKLSGFYNLEWCFSRIFFILSFLLLWNWLLTLQSSSWWTNIRPWCYCDANCEKHSRQGRTVVCNSPTKHWYFLSFLWDKLIWNLKSLKFMTHDSNALKWVLKLYFSHSSQEFWICQLHTLNIIM